MQLNGLLTIINKQMKRKGMTYPIQMQSKNNGIVVEFINEHEGSVVKTNANIPLMRVGDEYDDWIPATSCDNWRVYIPPKEKPIELPTEETLKQWNDIMANVLTQVNDTFHD